MNMRVVLAGAIALSLSVSPAFAGKQEEARTMVDGVAKQTLGIITSGAPRAEKQKKLEKMFSGSIDVPWISRFVLGRHWRTATPVQKDRYTKAYQSFVVSSYASRFADLDSGGYRIISAREEDDSVTVSMEMTSESKQVLVDYRVHSTDKGLKVFDVVVEGVSLLSTQRSEFASVLNNQGLDHLIDQLASHRFASASASASGGEPTKP